MGSLYPMFLKLYPSRKFYNAKAFPTLYKGPGLTEHLLHELRPKVSLKLHFNSLTSVLPDSETSREGE